MPMTRPQMSPFFGRVKAAKDLFTPQTDEFLTSFLHAAKSREFPGDITMDEEAELWKEVRKGAEVFCPKPAMGGIQGFRPKAKRWEDSRAFPQSETMGGLKGIHPLVCWVIHVLWVIGCDLQEGGSRIPKWFVCVAQTTQVTPRHSTIPVEIMNEMTAFYPQKIKHNPSSHVLV